MKINKAVPVINKGVIISVTDEYGERVTCEVVAVWYPKKGDKWSEASEAKHLGYLHSTPSKPFPQLRVRVCGEEDVYGTVFGDEKVEVMK
jgi:hypothetical protein